MGETKPKDFYFYQLWKFMLFVSISVNLRLDDIKTFCPIAFSPLASPYFIHWP